MFCFSLAAFNRLTEFSFTVMLFSDGRLARRRSFTWDYPAGGRQTGWARPVFLPAASVAEHHLCVFIGVCSSAAVICHRHLLHSVWSSAGFLSDAAEGEKREEDKTNVFRRKRTKWDEQEERSSNWEDGFPSNDTKSLLSKEDEDDEDEMFLSLHVCCRPGNPPSGLMDGDEKHSSSVWWWWRWRWWWCVISQKSLLDVSSSSSLPSFIPPSPLLLTQRFNPD